MEKTVSKKFCDICEREVNYLQKCIVCGKEHCITCDAVIPGCAVNVDCCKICAQRDDVIQIVKDSAEPIFDIVKKRNMRLQGLLSI